MGDRTFATFKSNLQLALGNRDDMTAYLGNWINSAYRTLTSKNYSPILGRKFTFPEIETDVSSNTTNGTPYISKPTDCLFVQTIDDTTTDKKLHNISWMDYIGKTGRATSSQKSNPSNWVTRGSYIYLFPTPDATYVLKVYYRKRPAALTGTGTTDIGSEWDDILENLAIYQSFMRLGEPEKAKFYYEHYMNMISDILGIYDREDLDRESKRKPHPSYYDYDNWTQ